MSKLTCKLLWGINNRNVLVIIDGKKVGDMLENAYTSKFDGFIISINSSSKALAVADLNSIDIVFSIKMDF